VIIGVDIDGVLARDPLRLTWFLNGYWNWLLGRRMGRKIYRKRKTNERMRRYVYHQARKGHKIVLISAVWECHEKEVLAWLADRGVAYSKLRLKKRGEKTAEFKATVLIEEGCSLYWEDNPFLAREIAERLPYPVELRRIRGITAIKKR
jgi:uncharacterized HAD superfamily protein